LNSFVIENSIKSAIKKKGKPRHILANVGKPSINNAFMKMIS
jgi:hypothetical protein